MPVPWAARPARAAAGLHGSIMAGAVCRLPVYEKEVR